MEGKQAKSLPHCGDIEGEERDGGEGDGEDKSEGEVREGKGLFLNTK